MGIESERENVITVLHGADLKMQQQLHCHASCTVPNTAVSLQAFGKHTHTLYILFNTGEKRILQRFRDMDSFI